jgi:hypothetical protein
MRKRRVAARTVQMGGGGGEEAMGLWESTCLRPILSVAMDSSLGEREKEERRVWLKEGDEISSMHFDPMVKCQGRIDRAKTG